MSKRSRIPQAIAALATSLSLAAPAMAAQPSGPTLVPFHASYAGTYQAQVIPPNVIITATGGSGHATHLGRFELVNRIVVSLVRSALEGCPVPGSSEIYTATLTAANGDAIEGTGRGCQTSPTTVAVVDLVEVTGGTGRFEGASGALTVTSAVNQASRTVVVTFDGGLSRPGSAN